MELLIFLPLLLGVFALDALFGTGSSNDAADSGTPDTTGTSNDAQDLVVGSARADTLAGNEGDDLILGGSSSDKIDGGDGSDFLLGENGADTILGGDGLDLLAGGRGNDVLYGEAESDLLVGGRGNDLLYGGDGNDAISSTNGSDTLYGEAGDDILSGYDNVTFSTRTQVLANNLLATEIDAQEYFTDLTIFAATTYGREFTGQISGRVDAALTEFDAKDLRDDVLYGGAGNDALLADFSDTLTGGAGNDRFVVFSDGANEMVTITDFDSAQDTMRIFLPANSDPTLTLVDGATPSVGLTVLVGGDAVAQLLGMTSAQVTTTSFEVIVG